MLRCAIIDRNTTPRAAARLAAQGIDFLQLRDKSLPAAQLLELAQALTSELAGTTARLLVNGRADVALAARVDGVHLTAHPDELTPAQVRSLFANAHAAPPLLSISCHSLHEVVSARTAQANLILFGPVFEKRIDDQLILNGVGLAALAAACRAAAPVPVLALGGVTSANTAECQAAGAAGIAGIRLFQ